MATQETWFVTNNYSKSLNLLDIITPYTIKSGETVDLLKVGGNTPENLANSVIIRNYSSQIIRSVVNNGKPYLTVIYKHTHEGLSVLTGGEISVADSLHTHQYLDVLRGGKSSDADSLHTHNQFTTDTDVNILITGAINKIDITDFVKEYDSHNHTHNDLLGLNDGSVYQHLTSTQIANLSTLSGGSNADSLHTHVHNVLSSLQGGTTDQYYHLTLTQHDTLTDGSNADSLHTHDGTGGVSIHNDLTGIQGGIIDEYYHLTEDENNIVSRMGEDSSGLTFDNISVSISNHNDLNGLNVGDYLHLTALEKLDFITLTDGSNADSLHAHAHNVLSSLQGGDPSNDEFYHVTASQIDNLMSKLDWDQNGFENITDSTLTWTDSGPDRTLSIQPTGVSFNYFVGGVKYISSGDTCQIGTEEGIHVIYYDGETLKETANPTSSQMHDAIMNKALVSIVYWNNDESEAIYVGEERHGNNMSPGSHAYHHFLDGCRFNWGLGLNTMSVDDFTPNAASAQFGIDLGSISDEDLYFSISSIGSTVGLPIYYMIGATAAWKKDTDNITDGFSVRTLSGDSNTRLAFNEYTGGAWQLTQESNGDFVLYHIFATTEKDDSMISIMGQNGYSTKRAARSGAEIEIHNLVLDNILFPEIRPIATIILQTKLSYNNNVNARIVSTDDGDNYIDWRNEFISRVTVTTSEHNNLVGLQGGALGEYYHLSLNQINNLDLHNTLSDLQGGTIGEYYHTTAFQIDILSRLNEDSSGLTFDDVSLLDSLWRRSGTTLYPEQEGDSVSIEGSLVVGGGVSGQSLIASGLVVNEDGGGAAADDFRVETTNNANAFVVDASADEVISSVIFKANAGINNIASSTDITIPPSLGELDAIFGTPATLGAGFIGIIDDDSDDTDVLLCYTSDTSWYWVQGTKVV